MKPLLRGLREGGSVRRSAVQAALQAVPQGDLPAAESAPAGGPSGSESKPRPCRTWIYQLDVGSWNHGGVPCWGVACTAACSWVL